MRFGIQENIYAAVDRGSDKLLVIGRTRPSGMGLTVAVRDPDTDALLTLYAAATGATTIANPTISDPATGQIPGFAPQPEYKLDISGAGIEPYSINVKAQIDRGALPVNVKEQFYTGGTDTTNDLLNAAHRADTDGRDWYLAGLVGGWTWTEAILTGSQRFTIRGDGPERTILKQTVPGVEFATAGGSRGTSPVLVTENIVKNTQTFKVASVPLWLVPGATVQIRNKADVFLGSGGAESDGVGGEIVRIKTVDSGTGVCTTLGRIDLSYNLVTGNVQMWDAVENEFYNVAYTDDNIDIRPLTLATGLGFHDFSIWLPTPGDMGPGTFGIICPWTYGMRMSNVWGVGLDDDLVRVPGCVGGTFDDMRADDLDPDVAYGLHFHHSCQDNTVNNPVQRYSRHMVTSGGATLEPVPARTTTNNLHAYEPQSAPASEHPEARDWVWDGVTVYGGGPNAAAAQLRGLRTVLRNVNARSMKLVVHIVESADACVVENVVGSNVEDVFWVNGALDATLKNIEGRAVTRAGFIIGYATAGPKADQKPLRLNIERFRLHGNPSYAGGAFDLSAAGGYLGYGDNTMRVSDFRCPEADVPLSGAVESGVIIDDRARKLTVAPQIPHTEADGDVIPARVYVVRYVPQGLEPVDKIVFLLGQNAGANDAVFVGVLDDTGLILRTSGSALGHLNTGEDNPIGVSLTDRLWMHPGKAYYRAFYVPALTGGVPKVTFAAFQNAMAKAADDSLPDLESGYGTSISGDGTFTEGNTVSTWVNGGAPVLLAGTA